MIRIAILDLNEGHPNQGMRCIRDIIRQWSASLTSEVVWDEFEVRVKNEVPDLSYDIYISSGGPGSPLESIGLQWEEAYFGWLSKVEEWNNNPLNLTKKFVFFICHSFQLATRYFDIAQLTKRNSTAFGVYPVHLTTVAGEEPIFQGMNDPFYVVDSRDYQVVQPDGDKIQQKGVTILCLEKERPHVPYERAVMAIRFNDYMIGTQFHPEADAVGMSMYLQREDKKKTVIENYGEEKWSSMVEQLNDPDKILWTYAHILPNFLNEAAKHLQAELV